MKRIVRIVATLLVMALTGLVVYEVWPKYGLCPEITRYDEIVCVARRNLHFSAHMTWSFNRYTTDAVMAEVGPADIPVLVEMLGDERGVIRALAGNVLADLGEEGLAGLGHAAESPDPVVRRTAESALLDYRIIHSQDQPTQ